ncbi:two-component system sensor histidine kinase DesK [Streptomyces netropsis]|uniref:Two-component system sensor histidine kinase DesK n=2 Tax=Streptomyces netropsis TaxID=55404 RepID=A0A7W7LC85_STRNE|nr:two-component system sensor histidine kinase DesK [Streptomyces netropsis]
MGMRTRVWGWRSRSGVARVDSYTRWTVYLTPWLLLGLDVPVVLGSGGKTALDWTLITLGTAQCVLNPGLAGRAIDHRLGRGPAPWRRLACAGALFLATVGVVVAQVTMHGSGRIPMALWILMGSALSVLGSYSLLTRLGPYTAVCLGAGAALGVATTLASGRWEFLPTALVTAVFLGLWSVSVVRTSAWVLVVMWELDAARGAQARLAVAEERLRFGRDMHDVLGRNLAVIALKSELAVRLAGRGSPAALDEMTEVQRIAQESQREVRDVVRGYRGADLHTELAGARSVLAAAGIDCRIDDKAGEELPPAAQSALAWVVREATTNVLRHADAGRCAVRMRVVEGVAVLVMENDGVPSGPDGPDGGSGLAGLRERLADLGGTIAAERRPPAAFRLTARVPLARAGGLPPAESLSTPLRGATAGTVSADADGEPAPAGREATGGAAAESAPPGPRTASAGAVSGVGCEGPSPVGHVPTDVGCPVEPADASGSTVTSEDVA